MLVLCFTLSLSFLSFFSTDVDEHSHLSPLFELNCNVSRSSFFPIYYMVQNCRLIVFRSVSQFGLAVRH